MKVSEKELEIIRKHKAIIQNAADKYGWEPALIAAIGSRESRWGLLLDGQLKGDNGHGHGIFQIDDRSFGPWLKTHNWQDIETSTIMACQVLQDKYDYLKRKGIPEDQLDQGAVAAYNCGEGREYKVLSSGGDFDEATTGGNYSEDVFSRMEEIKASGIFEESNQPEIPDSSTGKVPSQAIIDTAALLVHTDYRMGAEIKKDADPATVKFVDCSELVEWACARSGSVPVMPDGAMYQFAHCHKHGTVITVAKALRIPGALLFKFSDDPVRCAAQGRRPATAHVAISLGNGETFEARGTAAGVGYFDDAAEQPWTHAALIPGVDYGEI